MPMMWGYYGNNAGMMVWGIIMSLFWLGLAVIAVWALLRWLSRTSSPTPPPQMPRQQSALDILEMRYARGELDTATYQSIREQLQAPTDSAQRPREAVPSAH
jgi:putative membrane protein